jgi:hypothetical protein
MNRTTTTTNGRTWSRLSAVRLGLLLGILGLFTIGIGLVYAREKAPSTVSADATTSAIQALDASSDARLSAQADAVMEKLHLPKGTHHRGSKSTWAAQPGRAARVAVDMVALDVNEQPVSTVQMDEAGNLQMATRLDLPTSASLVVSSEVARANAAAAASGIGFALDGQAVVSADPSTGGWVVYWMRSSSGVPVPGDGTTVYVWPDGTVSSVSHITRDLAPAPQQTMTLDQATAKAQGYLDRMVPSAHRKDYSVISVTQSWVPANGQFVASPPAGVDTTLHLCWVARVQTSGETAASVREVALYIDARSGALLGGDLVE